MKTYAPFLSLQLTRFGALTIPQMRWLCRGMCQKSTLYRTIGQWTKQGLLRRITHPVKSVIAYAATPELYSLVYGENHQRRIGVRETMKSSPKRFGSFAMEGIQTGSSNSQKVPPSMNLRLKWRLQKRITRKWTRSFPRTRVHSPATCPVRVSLLSLRTPAFLQDTKRRLPNFHLKPRSGYSSLI
jgi:hypothetical protein